MDIKGIFFDLDDTLHDHQKPFLNAFQNIFQGENIHFPIQELYKKFRDCSDDLWESYVKKEMSLGELREQRIILALKNFNMHISTEQARDFQLSYEHYSDHLELFSEVQQLLENVQKSELIVGIITNGPTEHQFRKIHSLGLTKYINRDFIFISEEVGMAKPNPAIFKHVSQKVSISPSELLYIGDSWTNDVIAPSNAGWKSIWFNHRKRERVTSFKPFGEIDNLSLLIGYLQDDLIGEK